MFDVAVMGMGPAGLSAAINVLQRNKTVCVFGNEYKTSMLYKAENVDNYIGMENVTGKEMMDNFYSHAKRKGSEFVEGRVQQIINMGKYFAINCENNIYQAKTIILAGGISRGKTIKGEADFVGKGVSYCATCDGMLYRGKTVCVVSDEDIGEEDAKFLAQFCKKVYYIPNYEMQTSTMENIEILKTKALGVFGDETVGGLETASGNTECDGVFFIKKVTPVENIIAGLKSENGIIPVDKMMKTNIVGVYAAGDCTGRPFQVSKAVGEGLIAGQEACKYIDENK